MQSNPQPASPTRGEAHPPAGTDPGPWGFPRSRLEPEGWVGRLVGALVLSFLCGLAAYGYFRYLPQRFPDRLPAGGPTAGLLARDVNLVILTSFLCAFVGFSFSRRYGLPGLGAIPGKARDLGLFVVAGLALGGLSFFAFDSGFRRMVPAYYPDTWRGALAVIPSATLFTEVVVRFGMMTIVTGIFRRPLVANLLTAAFFTLLTGARQLQFSGIRPAPMDPMILAGLTLTLVSHGILGTLYAKKGLFPCVVFHLAMDMKYLLCLLVPV